jgi:hypothetical protein
MAGLREYLTFRIYDDCIESRGRQIYFLRIHPKNMSILSFAEKLVEIRKFQTFLDADTSQFSIFVTDKTEDLNEISRYYKHQLELRPEYAFIIEPVINRISSIEQTSACIQRAFYIIVRTKDRREFETVEKQLYGKLDFSLTQKEELILVMRNYILREYTTFSLYVFEDAVKKHFAELNQKIRRNRKVTVNPFHEAKEANRAAIERIAAQMPDPADLKRDPYYPVEQIRPDPVIKAVVEENSQVERQPIIPESPASPKATESSQTESFSVVPESPTPPEKKAASKKAPSHNNKDTEVPKEKSRRNRKSKTNQLLEAKEANRAAIAKLTAGMSNSSKESEVSNDVSSNTPEDTGDSR